MAPARKARFRLLLTAVLFLGIYTCVRYAAPTKGTHFSQEDVNAAAHLYLTVAIVYAAFGALVAFGVRFVGWPILAGHLLVILACFWEVGHRLSMVFILFPALLFFAWVGDSLWAGDFLSVFGFGARGEVAASTQSDQEWVAPAASSQFSWLGPASPGSSPTTILPNFDD